MANVLRHAVQEKRSLKRLSTRRQKNACLIREIFRCTTERWHLLQSSKVDNDWMHDKTMSGKNGNVNADTPTLPGSNCQTSQWPTKLDCLEWKKTSQRTQQSKKTVLGHLSLSLVCRVRRRRRRRRLWLEFDTQNVILVGYERVHTRRFLSTSFTNEVKSSLISRFIHNLSRCV